MRNALGRFLAAAIFIGFAVFSLDLP